MRDRKYKVELSVKRLAARAMRRGRCGGAAARQRVLCVLAAHHAAAGRGCAACQEVSGLKARK